MANDGVPPRPRLHVGQRPVRRIGGWGLRTLVVTLLIVVPIVEIWALTVLGRQFGLVATFAFVLATSVLGLILVLREGSKAWRALLSALREGRMPSRELIEATLIVVGGLAFLVPGLVSDLVGLLLLIPFSRSLVRRLIGAGLSRQVARDRARSGVIAGEADVVSGPDRTDDVVVGQLLA